MLCGWLRPTKPQTALTPSSEAASKTRRMNACFVARIAGSWCSMLSKYADVRQHQAGGFERVLHAAGPRESNGRRRSSVLATGSSIASGGTSVSIG